MLILFILFFIYVFFLLFVSGKYFVGSFWKKSGLVLNQRFKIGNKETPTTFFFIHYYKSDMKSFYKNRLLNGKSTEGIENAKKMRNRNKTFYANRKQQKRNSKSMGLPNKNLSFMDWLNGCKH